MERRRVLGGHEETLRAEHAPQEKAGPQKPGERASAQRCSSRGAVSLRPARRALRQTRSPGGKAGLRALPCVSWSWLASCNSPSGVSPRQDLALFNCRGACHEFTLHIPACLSFHTFQNLRPFNITSSMLVKVLSLYTRYLNAPRLRRI